MRGRGELARLTHRPTDGRGSASSAGPWSEVLGTQAGTLGDPCQHAWPDLLVVVKRKDEIGPARAGQGAVRARLALERPSGSQEGRQHPSSTSARPRAQAALKEMLKRSGPASPCSSRSARTLRARAWTRDRAAGCVSPYARTPGNSITSASHRPSSSCSISTLKVITNSGSPATSIRRQGWHACLLQNRVPPAVNPDRRRLVDRRWPIRGSGTKPATARQRLHPALRAGRAPLIPGQGRRRGLAGDPRGTTAGSIGTSVAPWPSTPTAPGANPRRQEAPDWGP